MDAEGPGCALARPGSSLIISDWHLLNYGVGAPSRPVIAGVGLLLLAAVHSTMDCVVMVAGVVLLVLDLQLVGCGEPGGQVHGVGGGCRCP